MGLLRTFPRADAVNSIVGPATWEFPSNPEQRELPCFDPIHRSSGTRPFRRRIIARSTGQPGVKRRERA